jgi:hypothetical protein
VTGTVVQVSVSRGGIPKLAIPSADLTATGITGDAWRYPFHGGRRKAILLITIEGIDELISQGFPLFPGALGENVTTRGLDRRAAHRVSLSSRGSRDRADRHTHALCDARCVWRRHPGCALRCARAGWRSRVAAVGPQRLLRLSGSTGHGRRGDPIEIFD